MPKQHYYWGFDLKSPNFLAAAVALKNDNEAIVCPTCKMQSIMREHKRIDRVGMSVYSLPQYILTHYAEQDGVEGNVKVDCGSWNFISNKTMLIGIL